MNIKSISHEAMDKIVSAFADYQYEDGEVGLYYLCKGRQGTCDYMEGFAKAGIKSGWLHTISEKQEGYIMISEPSSKVSIIGMLDLIVGTVKGMGLRGAIQFMKDMKNAGTSMESKLKSEKKQFIQIEMLVVTKEYQNQGYMRKLLQIAFDKADQLGVPCIVSTDGRLKAEKYMHCGFELVQKRQFTENCYEHDLIRYPKKK